MQIRLERFISISLLTLAVFLGAGCASLAPSANTPAAPKPITRTSATDGKTMVQVSAGEFWLGTGEEQLALLQKDFGVPPQTLQFETPAERIRLEQFYIDQTPVTNAEYKKFIDADPNQPVPFVDDELVQAFNWNPSTRTFPEGRALYPVVLVTWKDANAYCHWAGKRLPTEAEWEKAARGPDGRVFPWGNAWDTSKSNSVEQGLRDATPVGKFPDGASPYGALDMVGNVWQWTSSLDKPYPYRADDGREDPNASGLRITRGGAWIFGPKIDRTSTRNHFDPASASLSIGFRCAQ